MIKTKLILDYDNTIVNSSKAFCELYNILYKDKPNFIPADYTKHNEYNFNDVCPLLESNHDNVYPLFENPIFFELVEFMNNDTKDVIEELTELYNVYICSIGSIENLQLKSRWLQRNLSCVKQHVLLINNNCKMDKSIVNMKDGIFIDDNNDNLNSSNANVKISFGKRFSWNEDWNGNICLNWSEIKNKLIQ